MGRYLSPRVAYWASAFESDMEAIAGEVALLRRHFPSSVRWGLSHRQWAQLSWRRGFCVHPRLHLLFRFSTRMLEPLFQLNHVFGSPGDWFYLQGRRARRTILTAAVMSNPVEAALLDRVDCFVVEYPGGRDALARMGIQHDRVHVVLPPVDLRAFHPSARPANPFTVLFASSPDDKNWLEARGVPQILTAAAARPHMRFRLLWRPWGNSLSTVQDWISARNIRNVEVLSSKVPDMAEQYRRAHVTVIPFARIDRCKAAPNSLVESLACGRPVVCTDQVGLSDLVREHAAGIVCRCTGNAVAEALDRIQDNWIQFSLHGRRLAEIHFDHVKFVDSYRKIYSDLLSSTSGK